MIKRYDFNYDKRSNYADDDIPMFEDGINLYGALCVNDGEWVKYDDIKHLLERSDNSDYTVPASPAPKLPALNDVKKMIYENQDGESIVQDYHINYVYHTIKDMGNFA